MQAANSKFVADAPGPNSLELPQNSPLEHSWRAEDNKLFHAMRNATVGGVSSALVSNFSIRDGSDRPSEILPSVILTADHSIDLCNVLRPYIKGRFGNNPAQAPNPDAIADSMIKRLLNLPKKDLNDIYDISEAIASGDKSKIQAALNDTRGDSQEKLDVLNDFININLKRLHVENTLVSKCHSSSDSAGNYTVFYLNYPVGRPTDTFRVTGGNQ